MAVSIITALREFNMMNQIKTEPFESSNDLFQLESRNDYNSTYDLSRRRSSECSECNGRADYECTSCMCQVCFHKTNAEKRYRCYFCKKVFHEWCRNNREIITAENKWLCAECKEFQNRATPHYNVSDELDVRDNDIDIKPTDILMKYKGTVDVNCNSTLANDDSDSMETEEITTEFHPSLDKVCTKIIRKMNNAPRSKICITVPSNHFGPIPGVPVGTCWKYRLQVSESGVHRPLVAGIHGRENEGAYSIVLSGVYEDDQDDGEEFFYSGCGGKEKDPRKRLSAQVADQTLKRHNKALALCCNAPFNDVHGAEAEDWKAGKPVRVIRNYKLGKFSIFAPEEGNRYDGIYKVVKYFPTIGKLGLLIWRYLLRRDDPSPAPWTEAGKRLIQENNLKVIYPEEEVMNEEYYTVVRHTKKIKQEIETSVRKRPHDYSCSPSPEDSKFKLKQIFKAETVVEINSSPISCNAMNTNLSNEDVSSPNINVHTMPLNITISHVSSNDTHAMQCVTDQERQDEVTVKKEMGFELQENTENLVNMDRWNKSTWDYCKTYLNISETEFLNVVKSMFTCPCCYRLVDSPVTTPCEHNICLECISNHFANKIYSCPQCHNFLGSSFKFRENKYLGNVLEILFPGYNFKLSKFI